MDPQTWKKEGISGAWTGARGYRRICCKNCCAERNCTGCKNCKGCINSPIRGNYDGLVVLAAVTRDVLPIKNVEVVGVPNANNKKSHEKFYDHEYYTVGLETALTNYFMYSELEFSLKCVPGNKIAMAMGDAISTQPIIPGERKVMKRTPAYAVYVAYRLTPYGAHTHAAKMSALKLINPYAAVPSALGMQTSSFSSSPTQVQTVQARSSVSPIHEITTATVNKLKPDPLGAAMKMGARLKEKQKKTKLQFANTGSGAYDIESLDSYEFGDGGGNADDDVFGADDEYGGGSPGGDASGGTSPGRGQDESDDEDEKMLEELEDKQMMGKISSLEANHQDLAEQVGKIEHDRSWVEQRLTTLEGHIATLKEKGVLPSGDE